MKTVVMAAVAALLASPAFAGELSGAIGVTSNYVSRGTQQDVNDEPDVFGTLTYRTQTGYYATVFASTMNYSETSYGAAKDSTKELDFFVGKSTQVGKTTVDVGLASINYPDNSVQWNFVEYYAKIDRPITDKVNGGVWLGYTNHYFGTYGTGIWTEAHASYAATPKLTISGAAANQQLDNDFDYRTWNVGATYAVRDNLYVDIRYSDTDGHDLDPLFSTYDAQTSVTLTATF